MLRVVNFIAGFATEVTAAASKVVLEAIRDRLPSALATDRLKVDGSGVTQPVSATALPLPTDAASATNQTTEIAGLAAILAKIIAGPATEAKQDTGNTSLGTLAGIVSAGKGLVTETSAASILAAISAMSAKLPAALGPAAATASLSIVFARSLSAVSATIAINGEVIKASSGTALWITITNTTGSSVYWQIFDLASGPPGAGARAAASAPAITANNGSRAGDLIGPTLGLGCNTGILLVLSLSPTIYSAVASTSCSYSIQYT